jgi:hypothetical protein
MLINCFGSLLSLVYLNLEYLNALAAFSSDPEQGLHSNMPMTILRLTLAVLGILCFLNLFSNYSMFDSCVYSTVSS